MQQCLTASLDGHRLKIGGKVGIIFEHRGQNQAQQVANTSHNIDFWDSQPTEGEPFAPAQDRSGFLNEIELLNCVLLPEHTWTVRCKAVAERVAERFRKVMKTQNRIREFRFV